MSPAKIRASAPLSFPRNLVPVANHDLVRDNARICEQIVARHLFRYLHFTAKLEHLVVNRTVLSLAHDAIGFDLPDWMRIDAYKIYCDEAYHALVAAQLATIVAQQNGLTDVWNTTPYFMRRLAHLIDSADTDVGPLLEILFVVCSETVISTTLTLAANEPGVVQPIRDALRDHAHDERRHHVYFAELLRHLWPQLSQSSQRAAGTFVPDLLDAFLRPDLDDLRKELCGYGLRRDDVEQIVAESYSSEVVDADRWHVARHTIRYFHEIGALAHPEVAAAFERSQLQMPATA